MVVAEESVTEGSFASYRRKSGDETAGQKLYNLKQLSLHEGQRVHASAEKCVLTFLSAQQDISKYIARLRKTDFERERGSGVGSSSSSGFRPSATKAGDKIKLILELDHVKGMTLLKRLQKASKSPISVEDACKWCVQMAECLSLAHSRYRISHGDLKLDNMMIETGTKNLVIIDWGSARWNGNTMKVRNACGNLQFSGPQFLSVAAEEDNKKPKRKLTYDAIKNDIFCLANIWGWIWSSVADPNNPQSAVGSPYDVATMQDMSEAMLLLHQVFCLDRLSAGPRHLSVIPKFFRDWILAFIQPEEKARPDVAECLYDMYGGVVDKHGKRVELKKFISMPLDDTGVKVIEPFRFPLTKSQDRAPSLSGIVATWEMPSDVFTMLSGGFSEEASDDSTSLSTDDTSATDVDPSEDSNIVFETSSNIKGKKKGTSSSSSSQGKKNIASTEKYINISTRTAATSSAKILKKNAANVEKRGRKPTPVLEKKRRLVVKHANKIYGSNKSISGRTAGLKTFIKSQKNLAMLD